MNKNFMLLALLWLAPFNLGCPPANKCTAHADCPAGQRCDGSRCVEAASGGGDGGGTMGGGTGGGTMGGGTGGGMMGGGTGGGMMGGGTGGGMMGGGTGGGMMGGGTGGGATGGGTGGGMMGGGTGGGATGGGTGGGGNTMGNLGESCINPFVVTGTMQLTSGSTADAGNDFVFTDATAPGCDGNANLDSTARDHVYRVSVPAGERVIATLNTRDAGVDSTFNIIVGQANCGMPNPDGGRDTVGVVCVAHQDDPEPQTLKFKNTGASAAEAYLLIDGHSSGSGDYTLNVDVGPTPISDDCDTPGPLTPGTPLTNQVLMPNSGFANDYSGMGTRCSSTSGGVDRVYSLVVPPGHRASIGVTPSSLLNTSISLAVNAGACGSRTCIASNNNNGPGLVDTIEWANSGASPATILLIVDTSDGVGGTFNISATTAPPPPGDTCSNVAGSPITQDTILVNQTLTGYGSEWGDTTVSQGCKFFYGPDRVYAVTVPANSRLTALGSSTSANLALNIIDGPPAACDANPVVCAVSADLYNSTASERVVFQNPTAMAKTVQVIVDRAEGIIAPDTFDLSLSLTAIPPPAYTKSTIPQACADTAMGTNLQGPVTDEGPSPITGLPFPFSFFGTPVTHFSVASNGYALLLPSSTGSTAVVSLNASIPSAGHPNGFLAPFWDDLTNVNPGTTMKIITTGTAPNRRFTMEWGNYTLYTTNPTKPERLTFQAQLIETTNAIEFHYCTIAVNGGDGPRSSGGSATIGVESFDGADGVQHSFNTGSSVDTTNALRFTP